MEIKQHLEKRMWRDKHKGFISLSLTSLHWSSVKPYLKRTREQKQGTGKQNGKVKQQVGLLEIDKVNQLCLV